MKILKGKEFYTVKEVMEILQLSRITIYRYINSDKLRTYKFGKDLRIRIEDFESFLEGHISDRTNNIA